MRAVIAIFYAIIITLATDLYALIAAPEWAGWVFLLSPITVSATIVGLLALDWLIASIDSIAKSVCHFASICGERIRKALIPF